MSDDHEPWLDELLVYIENYIDVRRPDRDFEFVLMVYAPNEGRNSEGKMTRRVQLNSNGKFAVVHEVLKSGTKRVEAMMELQRQRENFAEIRIDPANDEGTP